MPMTTIGRVSAVLVVGLAATVVGQTPAPGTLPPGDRPFPPVQCGTSAPWEINGRIRPQALPGGLADGEPFTFEQDPPLLFADYTGPVTLHNFSVIGDFATMRFRRATRLTVSPKRGRVRRPAVWVGS
jgi:hypothetical protein